MKRNWLIIIILFLLTANAALVSVLIINTKKAQRTATSLQDEESIPEFNPQKSFNFEEHLTKELELTNAQKYKIHDLSCNFHKQKKTYKDNMHKLKAEYFYQISSDTPNSEYQKLLADSLGKIHVELILLDNKHYRNIRSICTAEQAGKMDSLGKLHLHKRMGHGAKNKGRACCQNLVPTKND